MAGYKGTMAGVTAMIVCQSAAPFHPTVMRWFIKDDLKKPPEIHTAWKVGNFEQIRSWIHSLSGVPVEVLGALKIPMPPKGFEATLVCTGPESEGGIFKWEYSARPSKVDEPWWIKYQ